MRRNICRAFFVWFFMVYWGRNNPLRQCFALPPLPKGEVFAIKTKSRKELPLWGSWRTECD